MYQNVVNRGYVYLFGFLAMTLLMAGSFLDVQKPQQALLLPVATMQWDSTVEVKKEVPDEFPFAASGEVQSLYPNQGYDKDGWSLRGYMHSEEMKAMHIKDKATKVRFINRKAKVQRDFLDSMARKVLDVGIKNNIPPSIILAQAIIESNFGTSRLAYQGNNFFGIQYRGKNRAVIGKIKAIDKNHKGKSKNYAFNHYKTTWWALHHYAQLLNRKYKKRLLVADIHIRESWMAALCGCQDTRMLASDAAAQRKGGFYYAGACEWTANDGKTSRYVATLRYIINKYNLDKLDDQWQKSIYH